VKTVLDANVLLAAFGFGGVCRAVVDVCVESHELLLSDPILEEVRRHLQDKFGHSPEMADERVSLLRDAAVIVIPAPVPNDACGDRDDLPVLGTLVAAQADCLVTGDQELLGLGRFQECSILSPRQFWEGLKGRD
jgi:putative PIN family toxin of toxin-antitoxin system